MDVLRLGFIIAQITVFQIVSLTSRCRLALLNIIFFNHLNFTIFCSTKEDISQDCIILRSGTISQNLKNQFFVQKKVFFSFNKKLKTFLQVNVADSRYVFDKVIQEENFFLNFFTPLKVFVLRSELLLQAQIKVFTLKTLKGSSQTT